MYVFFFDFCNNFFLSSCVAVCLFFSSSTHKGCLDTTDSSNTQHTPASGRRFCYPFSMQHSEPKQKNENERKEFLLVCSKWKKNGRKRNVVSCCFFLFWFSSSLFLRAPKITHIHERNVTVNSKNYSLDNSLYFLLFLFQTTRKIIKLKTFQLFLLQPTRRAAVEALNEILTNFTHTQNLLDVCEICAAAAAVSERETEE